ncbi:MAG: DMT family transporter, partial [Actinobacteria bacterium]|nr:DMT family transporter [Actinomycetota bacterium]
MIKGNSPLYKVMLVCAALIWGASFVILKDTLDVIPVNYLLTIRFSVAAIILGILFSGRMRLHANRSYMWRGLLLGGFLFTAYWFQTVGLTDTTPGKNAFLTAAYVVVVPFLFWAVTKKAPDVFNVLAALLLITGVGFVSLSGDLSIRFGDWMTLVAACFYAAHIVAVAVFARGRDILVLTVYQFLGAALLALAFGCTTEVFPGGDAWTPGVILSMLYLAIPATCIALLFQNIGQAHVNPAASSVLLSLESVFGVLFSVIFYGEALTFRLVVGFALIFLAVIVSDTKLFF